MVHKFKIRI